MESSPQLCRHFLSMPCATLHSPPSSFFSYSFVRDLVALSGVLVLLVVLVEHYVAQLVFGVSVRRVGQDFAGSKLCWPVRVACSLQLE